MRDEERVSWWHWFHRWSKWGPLISGEDGYGRSGNWQRRTCVVCNLSDTKRV